MKTEYSVVIPVFNESGNIARLDAEIKDALASMGGTFEIIYVNDGSKDDSLQVLKELAGVTVIDLNRNYGQSTALDAGFKAATGSYVVSLDGDGQNDPRDIPALLEKLLQDDALDVVAGWRKNRKDSNGINILTRIGRLVRRILIHDRVHDTGCTLRAYRLHAVQSLDLQGEMHRYILALLRWKGFTIGEMVVNHRPRLHGKSNYGYSKAVRGLIDLVYIWFIHKYSQRPLHLFGYLALISGAIGAVSFFWSIYGKLMLGLSLNRNGWFFLTFFFLLASIIFFSFGIVIDLLIRIQFNTSTNEKRYYVREVIKK